MHALVFPFLKHGFAHRLLERRGDWCLVARDNRQTGSTHYEVIAVQRHQARTLPNGRVIPAGEAYPSTAQWGKAGWTYTDLPSALGTFTRMAVFTHTCAPKGGVSAEVGAYTLPRER